MTISPEKVRLLREQTQAGIMDCKKALQEAEGDMEAAVEVLRKRGMALARKKGTREAKEGMLGSFYDPAGRSAVLVEVNCETDFVVQTADFQNFVKKTVGWIREKSPRDIAAVQSAFQAELTALIAKIGENIQIRRFERWNAAGPDTALGFYLHAGSKIGVLVRLADPERKCTAERAKELAMHVAAMHPQFVRPEEIPAGVLDKEREILRAAVDAKKPKEIQEKIIDGKLKKFYAEACLEDQIFVKDPQGKKTVGQWVKEISPKARIEKFVRLQVGG